MVFRNIYCIQTQNLANATFVRVHIYTNPLIIIILLGSTWPRHIGVVLHDIPGTVDNIESTWSKPHGRWRDIIMSCFSFFAIFIIHLCFIMNTPVKRVKCFGCLTAIRGDLRSNVYPWYLPVFTLGKTPASFSCIMMLYKLEIFKMSATSGRGSRALADWWRCLEIVCVCVVLCPMYACQTIIIYNLCPVYACQTSIMGWIMTRINTWSRTNASRDGPGPVTTTMMRTDPNFSYRWGRWLSTGIWI
jgi:hypothetical protein